MSSLTFPPEFPFNRRATDVVDAAANAPTGAAADAEVPSHHAGPPPGIPERRRVPRQTLVAKATVRAETNAPLVTTGFVSNISLAGVGFHTRKPLTVGDKDQIRLEVGPMKWASRLRIVTCQQHGDTFDVGAEFVGNELKTLSRREIAA
jgi:hypothetical protein